MNFRNEHMYKGYTIWKVLIWNKAIVYGYEDICKKKKKKSHSVKLVNAL